MKFKPTKKIRRNAQESLDCISNGSTAMTSVGRTRARQLASGKPISLDVVKRMYKFKRHKKNSKIDDPSKPKCQDKGYVAWQGWGGDEGINWAKRIAKMRK
jgi:hypothetical protein